MVNYQAIPELQLPQDLQQRLVALDWRALTVTTEANRYQVIRRIIRSGVSWFDYLSFYGWFLGRVGTVKNLRIDPDLEQAIAQIIQSHFNCQETPVLRLQVMFGGEMLPLHTDITRHASLVIPVSNHASAITNFYESIQPVNPALPNPMQCMCIESTVISVPTLINTDCIHSVVYREPVTEPRPRISLTAKWADTKFQELV